MRKKHLSITLAVLFIIAANHASAQVYTIKAKYNLLSIYTGEYHQLWFDRIDTGNNYILTADFDKKTVTDPTDSYSPLPITEIVHEEGSMFYILKVKPDKWVKWRYYKLMVNHLGQPVYIQETDQQKDRDERRDTFFHTYTSNLATLSFYKKYVRIKDMALNENQSSDYSDAHDMWKQPWKFAGNTLEMRNGYINWITGGETHHLEITEVYLVKKQGSDGIRLVCTEKDGELYDISYVNSDKRVEENQYGKESFIYITKNVSGKRVWAAILI